MTSRKFYKTIVRFEVLSEEPIGEVDLDTIHHQTQQGDWSGLMLEPEQTVLNGAEAAEALVQQGSDPGFFGLTEEGEEAEDAAEDAKEQQRRDEKNGLYPQHEDPAN